MKEITLDDKANIQNVTETQSLMELDGKFKINKLYKCICLSGNKINAILNYLYKIIIKY